MATARRSARSHRSTSATPATPPTRSCRRSATSTSPTRSTASSRSRPTATRCSAPRPRSTGLWLAEGIWVTHAGGSGRAVAELMTAGRSEIDMRQSSPDRFQRFQTTRAYVRARGAQQYREVYDIIHPLQQMEHPRGLRTLPYQQRIEEAGAVFVESAGWERAQWFESNAGLPEPPQRPAPRRVGGPAVVADHRPRAPRHPRGLRDLRPDAVHEGRGRGAGRGRLAEPGVRVARWTARWAGSSTRPCSTSTVASSATSP